eukprot:PhF_6_TR3759/c0_g1_i2/m.5435
MLKSFFSATSKLGNSGLDIPTLGLGVFQMNSGDDTTASVLRAIQLGYRHIDTAKLYGNERDVGLAIRRSGIPRDEFFVTTKVWNDDQGYDTTIIAGKESLQRLGIGHIDLLLLHAPVIGKRLESYRALVELQRQGVTRSIGVSNYNIKHLEEIASAGLPMPACNQIEVHPFLQRREVVEYCQRHNITVVAYSPLVKGKAFDEPTVRSVASAHGVTGAQVLLRWGVEKGFVVIPKSTKEERQRENSQLGFRLTDDDMRRLDELDRGWATGWDPLKWE